MVSPTSDRSGDLGHPEITEIEIGKTTHKVADTQPMDVDGVRTMIVGTAFWAVAAIALVPFWGTLRENGAEWWLWSALAGFGLGLIGIEYCRRHRQRSAVREQPVQERPTRGRSAGGRRRK